MSDSIDLEYQRERLISFLDKPGTTANARPLFACHTWVTVRLISESGRIRKWPLNEVGSASDHNDEDNHVAFKTVLERCRGERIRYGGAGFVFTQAHPFVGVDVDHYKLESVIAAANLKDPTGKTGEGIRAAVGMILRCNTLTTRSVSGKGFHLYLTLTDTGVLARLGPSRTSILGCIEIYASEGYFAETFDIHKDMPIADGAEPITYLLDQHEKLVGPLSEVTPSPWGAKATTPVVETPYASADEVLVMARRINPKIDEWLATPFTQEMQATGKPCPWGQRLRDVASDIRKTGAAWAWVQLIVLPSPFVRQSWSDPYGKHRDKTRADKAARLLTRRKQQQVWDAGNAPHIALAQKLMALDPDMIAHGREVAAAMAGGR